MEETVNRRPFRVDYTALISLVVAITALLYTSWRENVSEHNHNTREAGFEVLKDLGQLQAIVNLTHFPSDTMRADPYLGWSYVSLISDLSQLLPSPVPETAKDLVSVWGENWGSIKTDEAAVINISAQIDKSRKVVLEAVKMLK